MGLHHNVFIGHVETFNTDAKSDDEVIESKVIALKLVDFDVNKKIPKYQAMKKYSEYYKLISVEPILGLVSDSKINKALKSTGKKEVKVLKKVA